MCWDDALFGDYKGQEGMLREVKKTFQSDYNSVCMYISVLGHYEPGLGSGAAGMLKWHGHFVSFFLNLLPFWDKQSSLQWHCLCLHEEDCWYWIWDTAHPHSVNESFSIVILSSEKNPSVFIICMTKGTTVFGPGLTQRQPNQIHNC